MIPSKPTITEDNKGGSGPGVGCAAVMIIVLLCFALVVATLLAWPYFSSHTTQAATPGAYQNSTPLLPPPEHSDLGPEK